MKETFDRIVQAHEKAIRHYQLYAFEPIMKITESIIACFDQGGKIMLAGNGGSAADCQHIAGEFVGRYRNNRVPLPAVALCTDTSVITCIANDYDYESIFSRQVEALGREHDILWVFSTSGSSKNILKAVHSARTMKIKTISFTGKPDSLLEDTSDICLCARTEATNHAQEIHLLSYHIICEYIDQQIVN